MQERDELRVATGVGEVEETREGLGGTEDPFYMSEGALIVLCGDGLGEVLLQ